MVNFNQLFDNTPIDIKYAFYTGTIVPDPKFAIPVGARATVDLFPPHFFDVVGVFLWTTDDQPLPGFSLTGDPSVTSFTELYQEDDGTYAIKQTLNSA